MFPSHGLKKGGNWGFSPYLPDPKAPVTRYTGLQVRKPGIISSLSCDLAQGSVSLSGKWVDWINNDSHHYVPAVLHLYLSHTILTSAEPLAL